MVVFLKSARTALRCHPLDPPAALCRKLALCAIAHGVAVSFQGRHATRTNTPAPPHSTTVVPALPLFTTTTPFAKMLRTTHRAARLSHMSGCYGFYAKNKPNWLEADMMEYVTHAPCRRLRYKHKHLRQQFPLPCLTPTLQGVHPNTS